METVDKIRIGEVTIKTLRNLIIDHSLDETDTIVLNTVNFDEIVLEYRRTYQEPIPIPFYFMKVLICERFEDRLSINKVKMIKDDPLRSFEDYIPASKQKLRFEDLAYADKTIFRCGYCGNVVDSDGAEFDSETQDHKHHIWKTFDGQIQIKQVHGRCCPHGLDQM